MKIGDRVFVHGYVDEIRKDTVIIRNKGGYFGTDPSEVITGDKSEIDWNTIEILSDIRATYNMYDNEEADYYEALTKAIKVLKGEEDE